jgi:integrase
MSEKYVHLNERGQWTVDLPWPDGIRKRRVMPHEKKANEISIRFQSAKVDGTWADLRRKLDMNVRAESMTFREFGQRYLDEYVKSYNRSCKSKKSRIRILGRKLDRFPIDALQPQHVSQFVAWRKGQKVKNRTINRDLIVLKHMLSWGVRERYLERNPLPEIQRLEEIQWEGQRPTEEIIDAVFAKLDERALPLFVFLRETGCRREEALSLKPDQVNITSDPPVAVFRDNTKNGKSRQVPLTRDAIDAINKMPKGVSNYVFYHPESLTRWHDCRKVWEEARQAAGFPWLRIHDLRHAYGIKLREGKTEMHDISAVLGHHSIDFTAKHYAKYGPESTAKRVLKVLEGGKSDRISTNLPLSAA